MIIRCLSERIKYNIAKSKSWVKADVIDFLISDSPRPHRDLIDRFSGGVVPAGLRIEFVLMVL